MSIFPSLSLSRARDFDPNEFFSRGKIEIRNLEDIRKDESKNPVSRFVYETNNLINSFFFLSFFLSSVSVSHDKKLVELIETLLLFRERKYSYDSILSFRTSSLE